MGSLRSSLAWVRPIVSGLKLVGIVIRNILVVYSQRETVTRKIFFKQMYLEGRQKVLLVHH